MKTIKIAQYNDYDIHHEEMDTVPSSPYATTVVLYNEATDQETVAEIIVEFDLDATEMEGLNISSPGEIFINSIELDEDVRINGKIYPAGTDIDLLDEFITYDLDKRIKEEILNSENKFPTKHYPTTR